jgi:hypothetical protein
MDIFSFLYRGVAHAVRATSIKRTRIRSNIITSKLKSQYSKSREFCGSQFGNLAMAEASSLNMKTIV